MVTIGEIKGRNDEKVTICESKGRNGLLRSCKTVRTEENKDRNGEVESGAWTCYVIAGRGAVVTGSNAVVAASSITVAGN